MINQHRMVNEFIELAQIDSLTRQERQMADRLTQKLRAMGLEVYEDNAGEKIGGNAGNLIIHVKGSKPVPAILLMAHMDTVVPGLNKKPQVRDGYIVTDGTTVLGGDDLAGVTSILEALRVLAEDDISHGDIQVVFSIAEEGGLFGAKNLDYSKINAKYGFILDSDGEIGSVAVRAPSQDKITATIHGKAAHAGMEPENGISAIQIAARAIANMKLGRLDEETTANIGIIQGGQATNIIPDRVLVHGEARSRNEDKRHIQSQHMKECFEEAAEYFGGRADIQVELEYPAFSITEDAPIISILRDASELSGIPLRLFATGGGSDTNIVNGKGIMAVDVAIGMDKVHSVEERLAVSDMIKGTEFLLSIIQSVK